MALLWNTWHLRLLLNIFILLCVQLVLADDFYQLLKVDRNADKSQIKKAYRKASLEYHPDKNPGMCSILTRE